MNYTYLFDYDKIICSITWINIIYDVNIILFNFVETKIYKMQFK